MSSESPRSTATFADLGLRTDLTKALNDLVLADEFPLNVFYEALRKKLKDVVESTSGITATTADHEEPAA